VLNLTHPGVREDAMAAYIRSWTRETENAVKEFLQRHTSDAVHYNIAVEQMQPAAAIRRAAGRLHPDLIVLGTRGHGRLRRALLGSVARDVLNTATSDLLIIPDGSLRVPQWGSVRTMRSRARPALQHVSPVA
jgi:nucleotide-binding universal stress UspA family protein